MAARGLGKGLDALIPSGMNTKSKESDINRKHENEDGTQKAETIVNITKVEPNREQPRKQSDYYSQFLFRTERLILKLLLVKEDGVQLRRQD